MKAIPPNPRPPPPKKGTTITKMPSQIIDKKAWERGRRWKIAVFKERVQTWLEEKYVIAVDGVLTVSGDENPAPPAHFRSRQTIFIRGHHVDHLPEL